MKQVTILLLMFLILAQALGRWAIVLEYEVKKDYISKNLCENRNKPQLHCNGKCQLAKKMKEEEKENNRSNNDKSKSESPTVFDKPAADPVIFSSSYLPDLFPLDTFHIQQLQPRAIFRPPCV